MVARIQEWGILQRGTLMGCLGSDTTVTGLDCDSGYANLCGNSYGWVPKEVIF